MPDVKAKEYIAEYGRLKGMQANSRDLWQRTGDKMWPYVQIDSEYTIGTDRTKEIQDTTPMLDMLDMVSGFLQVLIPSGQTFFEIKVSQRDSQNDIVQRYLSYLTEASHEKIFESNFMIKMAKVLISMITFGPGCIFTEWKKSKGGLNYKVSNIGSYVIIEDDSENVIGSIHKFKLTAAQAYDLYGDKAGPKVVKAVLKPETMHDEFWFLYRVMPRDSINSRLSKQFNLNMPIAAHIIQIKDEHTVEEGGFPENPYAVGRWMRPEFEKDGRGIGTEMLPQINVLFEMTKDFKECGNKWTNPPRQALIDGVEGKVRNAAGALNWVAAMDNIKALDSAMNGSFPISEASLDRQTAIIDRAFFKQAFDPLADLKGDRRTTLEIQERIRGTLKKLGPPVGRIWNEQLTKTLKRSVLELIRNRAVDPPPPELSGVGFGMEYVGPLALALKSEQARGFQEWLNFVGQAHVQFPDQNIPDNIDFDDAIPRIGRTFGVHIEDMASVEERDAKRAKREQDLQQQKAAELAAVASKSYKDASGSPGEGSPAEALMAEVG
jgi:hypothetical protein